MLSQMATIRNKEILAGLNRYSQEDYPWNNLLLDTIAPRVIEEYITQVSGEIEGRVNKRYPRNLGEQSRILGALSKLDKFVLIAQV